ncbi:hypothetical protein MC885_014653, partial [Smutsia gigantea]
MARLWLSCLVLPALVVSAAANVAPTFLDNMTRVQLPEDLPVGAEAFWLVAQDQDNDKLTYGISGQNAYFFTVTPDTGKVELASPLDYETLYWFSIIISVSDGQNQVQKEMQVIVEDRNDNKPVFQNTAFSTSISETLPVGSVVFSVLAVDKDTGSAGAVVYFIEEVSVSLCRSVGPAAPHGHQGAASPAEPAGTSRVGVTTAAAVAQPWSPGLLASGPQEGAS